MNTTAGKLPACQITAHDLLHRCVLLRRDEDWREFNRRFAGAIRTMICRALVRFGRRLTAEEVDEHVQELYLHLLASAGRNFRGRTEEELHRYLARVIWNLVVDRYRRTERQTAAALTVSTLEPCWMQPQPSPERHAMARQGLAGFLESCRRAASGFQVDLKLRVIHLAFLDGCTSREIARRLSREAASRELTPGQVDSMIFRLRRRLAQDGIEVPRRYSAAGSKAA